jgi:hypothetical protein
LNSSDVTQIGYWLDIFVKGVIGIIVSMVGLDYRSVKNSLHELEQAKYQLETEVRVVRVELVGLNDKLMTMDKKLDRLVER